MTATSAEVARRPELRSEAPEVAFRAFRSLGCKEEMTTIYTALGAEDAEFCHPRDPKDFRRIDAAVDGTPRIAEWVPFEMELIAEDEGRSLRSVDAPWLSSRTLVFKRPVVDALGELLRQYGELLPVRCEGADVWIYNPRLLPALDEAASVFKRFSSGKIMMILKHVFDPAVVEGVDVFRIPTAGHSSTYFSDSFVRQWRSAELTGLRFTKVWSSK